MKDGDLIPTRNSPVESMQEDKGPQTSASDTPEATATPKQGLLANTDEASRLRELQADVRDQDDLERDISRQVLLID